MNNDQKDGRNPIGINRESLASSHVLEGCERLRLIRQLCELPLSNSRRTVEIKSDRRVLHRLYGGDIFTALSIRIKKRLDEPLLDVSFEFLRHGKPLPRGFGCTIEDDGTPFSILETFPKKLPTQTCSDFEGTGIFFGSDDLRNLRSASLEAEREKSVRDMLSRFDVLLQLAADAQDKQFSLN